ncbi:mCG1030798, partial [Mus musculus]
PLFFAKECFLDVPYARQTPQEPRVYKSTSFHLNYTLCFIISNWADQINTADTISQIAKKKV